MPITIVILGALLSLAVGSFLNVIIYRLPRQIITPDLSSRSRCPHCQRVIAFYHNLPIISFLLLKARCAYCQQPIKLRYLLVEILALITGIVVLLLSHQYLVALFGLVFSWLLITMSFIDIEHQLLPDCLTLSLLWLGLLANTLHCFVSLKSAVLGAIFAYLSLYTINWLFKYLRKQEGLGDGDMKLFAALGAWFGWQQLSFIILTSSLLALLTLFGLAISKKVSLKEKFAYGPFLAIAGWLVLLKLLFNI